MMKMLPGDLRSLIENSKEPLIIRGLLNDSKNWNIVDWSLEDWFEKIGKETKLVYRKGKYDYTFEPQWENCTEKVEGTFSMFLKHVRMSEKHGEVKGSKGDVKGSKREVEGSKEEVEGSKVEVEGSKGEDKGCKEWLYFDYKYLKEWLNDVPELSCIDWGLFGFPEFNKDDSTIWIGSKGAHTSCHCDTYGQNLVAQIYGRKMWLLFPPEEDLLPTRIPFEESSIYSQINFFSPQEKHIRKYSNCKYVVLEPGDVLFVPYNWWHYVESLETSISINLWIPHKGDEEKRLEEAIIQTLMLQLSSGCNEEERKKLLIPTQDLQTSISYESNLSLLEMCVNICSKENNKETSPKKKMKKDKNDSFVSSQINEDKEKGEKSEKSSSSNLEFEIEKIEIELENSQKMVSDNTNLCLIREKEQTLECKEFISKIKIKLNNVPTLRPEECLELLTKQKQRFLTKNKNNETMLEHENIVNKSFNHKFLSVLTDPDVINLIKSKLLLDT